MLTETVFLDFKEAQESIPPAYVACCAGIFKQSMGLWTE